MPVLDTRNIITGWEIPTEYYSDQPYIVKTDDGAWLCSVTTGAGAEGQRGQHVVTMRSIDQGKSWSDPVDVESSDGPEASYSVLLKVPGGRIYCFYNHNTDNMREVIADNPPYENGKCRRVDSLGYYVFKFSDDHGRSWSSERHPIPVREMAIDRENAYGGQVRFFWNVGKPFIYDGAAYASLHKVGGFGEGFFTRSEGVLLKSTNLLMEKDPEKITWETLPDGDAGLRTPTGGGPIAEEHSYSVLSDGTFYCVYRTIDGHPVCAYSRDQGHTWTAPEYQCFADGRVMKHPRAANFAWQCDTGKYVYWFHHHGGRFIRGNAKIGYEDRNPVWLCGGVETDTSEGKAIQWSQPELALYDDDPYVRISYPDLVEEGGKIFLTETQKDVARVHEMDPILLAGLWNQFAHAEVAFSGLVLDLPQDGGKMPESTKCPALPDFLTRDTERADYGTRDLRHGFTMELWLRLDHLDAGQVVLDNRTASGQGISLRTTQSGTLEIAIHDGRAENRWDCDPGVLEAGRLHHVVVIVDAGPKIIHFVVDGKHHDGGTHRQFGWGRFSPNLRSANGSGGLLIGPSLAGTIHALRMYDRPLRVSEAVGNFRAGC
ncbi:MAG: sialidase family protein [Candidatus Latescibacterota bacterium]